MKSVKKDHSVGEGSGALAGAVAGVAVGSTAGPVGTLVGAAVGRIVGAKAGGALAELVNPTDYTTHFENSYRTAPHYRAARRHRRKSRQFIATSDPQELAYEAAPGQRAGSLEIVPARGESCKFTAADPSS